MTLRRRFRFITLGMLAGLAVALWIWWGEYRAIATGQSAAGAGVGASHLLALISFPWSLGVLALLRALASATGADGPAFLRPFFYAMPLVAGAGWGWLTSVVWRRVVGRARSRAAV